MSLRCVVLGIEDARIPGSPARQLLRFSWAQGKFGSLIALSGGEPLMPSTGCSSVR